MNKLQKYHKDQYIEGILEKRGKYWFLSFNETDNLMLASNAVDSIKILQRFYPKELLSERYELYRCWEDLDPEHIKYVENLLEGCKR